MLTKKVYILIQKDIDSLDLFHNHHYTERKLKYCSERVKRSPLSIDIYCKAVIQDIYRQQATTRTLFRLKRITL